MSDTPRTTIQDRILSMGHAFSDEQRKYAVKLLAGDVGNIERELTAAQQRIKQLEYRIHRASIAFFRDGSDGQVASGMLAILEEERRKP